MSAYQIYLPGFLGWLGVLFEPNQSMIVHADRLVGSHAK
jgi:hypothetical protein